MSTELNFSVSDNEEEEAKNGTGGVPTTANTVSPPKTPSKSDASPHPTSVYVAYPLPVLQANGIHLTPAVASRHKRFLRTYKVLLVGEAGVGKSNLMHRYCYNQYDPTLPSTLGAEFCSREVDIPSGRVGASESVVIQLWDTAGQERSAGVISNAFYRNAVGALVVYDVTRRETLLNVPRWVARVMELAREECVCVVVGAKFDLIKPSADTPTSMSELETLQQEADRISHALGMRNFFTSALSGEGVLEAFTHLVLAVDAVQAILQEVQRAETRGCLQHKLPGHVGVAGRAAMADLQGSEMWTAASTVPASPVTLFHSSSRRWKEEPSPESHLTGQSSTPTHHTTGPAASGLQGSPGIASPVSGSISPGSVGGGHAASSPPWSLSSTPVKQKKTLDLRGFGPGEGGNAAASAAGSGGGNGWSWGC